MPLLDARDMLAFPGGDNSSDTVIGNVHFNLTTLNHWNYTLFSNGTLSNGSWCLLTFEPYTPTYVLSNGTFLNVTWCWSPTEPIGVRAGVGIGYAVLFAVALVLTSVNLTKHGKLHLPAEKRFWPIGRRWQWYWAAAVCATAMISLLTGVDVDRYFLPELPIILTSFFWYLMQICAIALVWEAVRHWGSWMERQFIDPDPFSLRQDDGRSKVELYVPLFFYLFLWLNFFMIVPRNWGAIQYQRYPQQTLDVAAPSATDARFKAAAFLLAVCWLITTFSLRHSIKYYCPRNRGIFNRIIGFVRYTPLRFMLIVPLAATIVAYQALVAWHFEYSPLKVDGLTAAIYAGGYTPALLIVFVQAIIGFMNPNEDLELQRQRRVRGRELDREMGVVLKPSWWRRMNGEHMDPNASMRDRLIRNVQEISGNKPTAPTIEVPPNAAGRTNEPVEMTPVSPSLASPPITSPPLEPYTGRSERRREERARELAAGLLFPEAAHNSATAAARRRQELMMDGPPPPSYTDTVSNAQTASNLQPSTVARSLSAQSSGSTNQPPQQIRSMLDV
ncbi:hypothetical protein C8A00DRAFT_18630 [Chaetomidium leptoderma]|uniref:Uncharacterized protein n=1 Tax=Chaetomidium leptoderma TaxID=669021 RepID=A0AAN6VE55_9PEZI|nr:hypothetical protein C8A00DRAFT_18630 [Chaetomidium leptoderma]